PRVGLDDVGARAVLDRPADVARQSLADRDTPTGVVGHGLHLDDGTLEALLGVDGDACRRRLSLASQRRAQRHTGTAEREDSQGRHNQGAEELGHFISPYGLVSGQQKEPHTPTAWGPINRPGYISPFSIASSSQLYSRHRTTSIF